MNRISILPLFAFILSCLCPAMAQELAMKFVPSQPLEGDLNTDAEESLPLYSARDSTIYFVRTLYEGNVGGSDAGQDIWYSKRQADGSWAKPENQLQGLNDENNNAVVGISENGNTLYLLNAYLDKDRKKAGMSFSFYQEEMWKMPKNIQIPGLDEKQGDFYGLYVTPAEDVVIISMQAASSYGQEDLFVSVKNNESGEWSKPVNLGAEINTRGFEISPFLSEDKRKLFFASNGHPGYGNADIFYAERKGNSWTNWSRPVNLGEEINSAAFDAYFSLSEDGQVFFASNRDTKMADIYMSRAYTGEAPPEASLAPADTSETELESEVSASRSDSLLSETQALLDRMNRIRDGEDDTEEQGTDRVDENAFLFLFDLNSADIQEAYEEDLAALADTLDANENMKVQIVGHADDTGGRDYNLKLSIERAVSVKRFLLSQGIDERRVITYGKGSTQPINDNESEQARQQNRRVVVGFF